MKQLALITFGSGKHALVIRDLQAQNYSIIEIGEDEARRIREEQNAPIIDFEAIFRPSELRVNKNGTLSPEEAIKRYM